MKYLIVYLGKVLPLFLQLGTFLLLSYSYNKSINLYLFHCFCKGSSLSISPAVVVKPVEKNTKRMSSPTLSITVAKERSSFTSHKKKESWVTTNNV